MAVAIGRGGNGPEEGGGAVAVGWHLGH
jgi:hypothetical protein